MLVGSGSSKRSGLEDRCNLFVKNFDARWRKEDLACAFREVSLPGLHAVYVQWKSNLPLVWASGLGRGPCGQARAFQASRLGIVLLGG
jgi:hypothetical protein